MKKNKRYLVDASKIHSLKDIAMEKERLKLEIQKTEVNIHADYHNLLHAFTLRNLASGMIKDITATSSVVGNVLSFGRAFLEKRKKKKQMRQAAATDSVDVVR